MFGRTGRTARHGSDDRDVALAGARAHQRLQALGLDRVHDQHVDRISGKIGNQPELELVVLAVLEDDLDQAPVARIQTRRADPKYRFAVHALSAAAAVAVRCTPARLECAYCRAPPAPKVRPNVVFRQPAVPCPTIGTPRVTGGAARRPCIAPGRLWAAC
jgi:hypothetical protein